LDYYDVSQVRFELEVKSSGLKSSNFSLKLSIEKYHIEVDINVVGMTHFWNDLHQSKSKDWKTK
jgi:hypothetical protein